MSDNVVQLDWVDDGPAVSRGEPNRWQLGRYAEFMVCAELTRLGYYVTHVDAPGFDLILVVGTTSLRVQVRSTSSVREGLCSWPLHTGEYRPVGQRLGRRGRVRRRTLDRGDADLVALFHHRFGTTVFMPLEGERHEVKLSVSQVMGHEAVRSLENTLMRLGCHGSP